jgi:hypothetical protein
MAKSAMKALGTLFEQRFVLKCLEHGLHPFSPIEEGLPQDMLVMNQFNEVIRVQIKGTQTPVKEWKTPRYKITAATGKNVKKIIDCDRIDIMVAHVDPDAWYIIPCTEVKSVRVWLYPYDSNSSGQYERFRDRWDLLTGCSEITVTTEPDSYSLLADSENTSYDSWTHSGFVSGEDHI